MSSKPSVGQLLRGWRQRRQLSQLDLACEAEVSARHVSFLETGRALPSREMLLRLCERLDIPLRERNALLVAAGLAPVYRERPLDDPIMTEIRQAIGQVLAGHEPYPALAVDRHWRLLASNRAVASLLEGVAPTLLAPPTNVLRLSLHPEGLAPRIENLAQWRGHLLARLRHQLDATGDPLLADLLAELRGYPLRSGRGDTSGDDRDDAGGAAVVVPLRLQAGGQLLSFFSTTTVFGTPRDVTVSELAIESFLPADPATAEALRHLADSGNEPRAPQRRALPPR
jgi:transcriptional regulator with XRE-family HTH domain